MRTDLFDYHLPSELIAQTPQVRGQSRLLVVHRDNGSIEHRQFADLPDYLQSNDHLVFNDTRVIARRLLAVREGGETAEVLLLRPIAECQWEALVRPGKGLKPGRSLRLIGPAPQNQAIHARVVECTSEGGRILEFDTRLNRDIITSWGEAPLPPYIHTPLPADQEERYQTVYARKDGSAAAPTAGLHFTPELLSLLTARGIDSTFITLHIGVDTFRPVRTDEIEAHEMHGEFVSISQNAAEQINATTGRVVAVGTTSVRALESAAARLTDVSRNVGSNESAATRLRIGPFSDETHLFISPGFHFRAVDAVITNFHLPRSTLLMLISGFAGRDIIMNAYAEAVKLRYRFYSFGDAMLII